MLTFRVLVALGETEINDVNVVTGRIRASNEEVIRLDITVDNPLFMNLLNTAHQLNCNHEHSFEIEVALARLEKVFKRWPKQIHDHDMELHIGD